VTLVNHANRDEAVIVRLKLSDDEFGQAEEREAVFAIEDRLTELLAARNVGEVDGHEFGIGFATLYMYGPSAEQIADVVLDLLAGSRHRDGSALIKRFGRPGSREESVYLSGGSSLTSA
jgi:hypothetical protein